PMSVRILHFLPATAPPDIYPLSLHDALPISAPFERASISQVDVVGSSPERRSWSRIAGMSSSKRGGGSIAAGKRAPVRFSRSIRDRKSTRLNSSHVAISYAVFCLKKKKKTKI